MEGSYMYFKQIFFTLAVFWRQCSNVLSIGSSLKRAKPEWVESRIPASSFTVWINSSTVVEPSKPTTYSKQVK